jgi:hypothetical protein
MSTVAIVVLLSVAQSDEAPVQLTREELLEQHIQRTRAIRAHRRVRAHQVRIARHQQRGTRNHILPQSPYVQFRNLPIPRIRYTYPSCTSRRNCLFLFHQGR